MTALEVLKRVYLDIRICRVAHHLERAEIALFDVETDTDISRHPNAAAAVREGLERARDIAARAIREEIAPSYWEGIHKAAVRHLAERDGSK